MKRICIIFERVGCKRDKTHGVDPGAGSCESVKVVIATAISDEGGSLLHHF